MTHTYTHTNYCRVHDVSMCKRKYYDEKKIEMRLQAHAELPSKAYNVQLLYTYIWVRILLLYTRRTPNDPHDQFNYEPASV